MNLRAHSLLLAALLAGPALAVAACGGSTKAGAQAVVATHTTTLSVSGMTCASCAVTVKAAVTRLDGIASVEVDVEAGEATVEFDAGTVTAQQIAERITGAGYEASVRSTDGV